MAHNNIDWTPVIRAQKHCSRKVIQRTSAAILKKAGMTDNPPKRKFSFNSKNDLLDVYKLAAYLFVFGKYELCFDVCSICDHVVFNGNYDVWNLIECLRVMKIYIFRMKGNETAAQQLIDVLREHEAPTENYERYWKWLRNRAINEFTYEEYHHGIVGKSSIRYLAMGTCMSCIQYIQMGYLPDKHDEMQEWSDKIIAFLRREEK